MATPPAPSTPAWHAVSCPLMEARDADGYVFRTDLRLRPDPAATPPCIALPAAIAYYESMGQNWERAAMLKARPVAGDLALGAGFLEAIRPFVWRRHLDFAAVADIHAMKRRIDAHKGTGLGRPAGSGGAHRRPQRQARPGRHSRNRVHGADPATGLGRPRSRRCARRARWTRWRLLARAGHLPRARRRPSSAPPTASCAGSSTGCKWWPTGRPTRCPTSARARGLRPVHGLPGRHRLRHRPAAPPDPRADALQARCSRPSPTRTKAARRPPLDFSGTDDPPPATAAALAAMGYTDTHRWWTRCAAGRPDGCGRCARSAPAT